MNQWMNDETDCRTAPATPGLLNTPEIHLRIIWVRVQIWWPRATSSLQVLKLWALVYPGWIRGESIVYQGWIKGLHAEYRGSIWGSSGVSGPLNSEVLWRATVFWPHCSLFPRHTPGYTQDTPPIHLATPVDTHKTLQLKKTFQVSYYQPLHFPLKLGIPNIWHPAWGCWREQMYRTHLSKNIKNITIGFTTVLNSMFIFIITLCKDILILKWWQRD